MRNALASIVVPLLMAAMASAQVNVSRQYTRPGVPSTEALDRLHLKLAWRTYLPVDGFRDGILTVQALEDIVLVQLRSGKLLAINGQTGRTQWQFRPELPYRVRNEVGYNDKLVFAMSGTRLAAIDRASGQLRWDYELGPAPSAPPAADA